MTSLGRFYRDNRQYDRALRVYRRTLALREERFGARHPAVAAILDTIGTVLSAQGHLQEALEHHSRALEIYQSNTASTTPDEVVRTLTAIGECHLGLGSIDQARPPLERAMAQMERMRASDMGLARVRFALARVLGCDDETRDHALLLAHKARRGFEEAEDLAMRSRVVEVDRFLSDLRRAT
jgi:tetratricopeptide (TPR) repeat protein